MMQPPKPPMQLSTTSPVAPTPPQEAITAAPSALGSLPATGAADALQEQGADRLDARQPSRLGGPLAGGDTRSFVPADESEAEAALEAIDDFCATYCPELNRCRQEGCDLWNLEQRVEAFLEASRGPAEAVGVLPVQVTA